MSNLKINELSYSYKKIGKNKKLALKNLNTNFSDGLTVILGPNGAGKTTFIKLITTLSKVQGGEIFLEELNYRKDEGEIRKRIGYLPQNFSVYPELTGREFLQIMIDLKCNFDKHKKEEYLNSIISDLEMESYIDNKFKTYSGGMKQKLGIAQLLIGDIKVMVLDEPTVGLDPEQRNNIREIIPKLSRERIVIVTTHIVEDIEMYCDNLVILKSGSIIYQGSVKSLINLFSERIYKVTLSVDRFKEIHSELKIIKKVERQENVEIIYLKDQDIIETSQEIVPSLEEAYLAIQLENKDKGN